MFEFPYLTEILTPKRSDSHQIQKRMAAFAGRYRRILASGCGVSIPDNPMGQPRCSALEAIQYFGLPLDPEKAVMNLNTFHTKEDLDGLLNKAVEMGLKYLLVVRGDGGPDLRKLEPGDNRRKSQRGNHHGPAQLHPPCASGAIHNGCCLQPLQPNAL